MLYIFLTTHIKTDRQSFHSGILKPLTANKTVPTRRPRWTSRHVRPGTTSLSAVASVQGRRSRAWSYCDFCRKASLPTYILSSFTDPACDAQRLFHQNNYRIFHGFAFEAKEFNWTLKGLLVFLQWYLNLCSDYDSWNPWRLIFGNVRSCTCTD